MRSISLRLRRVTAYVSDVEGSTIYWEKYLAISRIIRRNPQTRKIEFTPFIAPGDDVVADTHFVFGGDAVDKGGDDLTFVADLNQLKHDFPDRVTLLIGNRDVNKMRIRCWGSDLFLTNYLSSAKPEEVAIPYFMADSPKVVSYDAFLKKHANRFGSRPVTQVSYLLWRLECTMGCEGLFESRRDHLFRTKKQPLLTAQVSDEEVAESFFASVRPGGDLHTYLSHAQLSAVVGNTLFVHGGVTAENAGCVPTLALEDVPSHLNPQSASAWFNVLERGGSIQDWSDALNAFWRDAFGEWDNQPLYNPTTGRLAGASATAYAHMKATQGKTVIVQTFTDGKSKKGPKFLDLGVVEHCNVSGIFRMCAGHKPVGDIPLTIQQPGLSIHVVDNSYCDVKTPDGRGDAVQELLLDDSEGTAIVHGRRSTGAAFEFALDDPLVGIPLHDGWWTRGTENGGQSVIAHRTADDYFTNEYQIFPKDTIESFTQANPMKSVADGDFYERYTRSELKPMKRKVLRPFVPRPDGAPPTEE